MMFALKSCAIKALSVERVSIEGRGPRPHISCIEKSLACRQAVKIATNKDDTAVDGFADTWRLMQLGYKDTRTATCASRCNGTTATDCKSTASAKQENSGYENTGWRSLERDQGTSHTKDEP